MARRSRHRGLAEVVAIQAAAPSTRPPRSLAREDAPIRIQDRWSSYPARGLTPSRLAAVLQEADAGYLLRWAELCEDIEERDAHLAAVLQTRRLGVAGAGWDVTPSGDSSEAVEIADQCARMLGSIPSLSDALVDLLSSLLTGTACTEIMWDVSSGQAVPARLQWRHLKRFAYNVSDSDYPVDELLLITDEEPSGTPLRADKWLVHRPRSRSGWASRGGLGRALAWLYLLKIYATKDWATFCERQSIPMRLGTVGPQATDQDRAALRAALGDLGSDAAAVVSGDTKIELVGYSGTSGAEIFPDWLSYLNDQISKAVLGHSAAADTTPGRLGGEDGASAVRQDLVSADAVSLAETLTRQLIEPWCRFNFGAGKPLPRLAFRTTPQAKFDMVYPLIALGGRMDIPASWVRGRLGIPAPRDGEQILAPAAPVAGPDAGSEGGAAGAAAAQGAEAVG